jgi:ABC-type Na+ transport system ATPase subunit NatA
MKHSLSTDIIRVVPELKVTSGRPSNLSGSVVERRHCSGADSDHALKIQAILHHEVHNALIVHTSECSALDNKTQRQVSQSLDKLKCTRIVIAHRLSTIKHCDRILILDGGKIVEEGTYEELIEKKGFFADLVERQRLDVSTKKEDA